MHMSLSGIDNDTTHRNGHNNGGTDRFVLYTNALQDWRTAPLLTTCSRGVRWGTGAKRGG